MISSAMVLSPMSSLQLLVHFAVRYCFVYTKRLLALLILAVIVTLSITQTSQAQSRIKDIVNVEGVRDNVLVGYGLVVGLQGSGDSLTRSIFTRESIVAMLQRLGVNSSDGSLRTRNIAAVMVTATLPAFSRQGSRIDVTVSALGDASSLRGGTLFSTPLMAADGEVYAVAQGQVAVGGFQAQGNASSISRGVPTNGRISSGGIVEREVAFSLDELSTVRMALINPDFTTARRISRAINAFIGNTVAQVSDPSTVIINIPGSYSDQVVDFIADVEQLRVDPDQIARVVIDEQSGIVVMGNNVRINPVAIAQGNLTIRITETPQVSQPQPFSNTGETTVVPRTTIQIDSDADQKLTVLNSGVSIEEVVNALNSLGIGPRDMITILQAIKVSGALQAEIRSM